MRQKIKEIIIFLALMMIIVGGLGMDAEDLFIPVALVITGSVIIAGIGLMGGFEEYEA